MCVPLDALGQPPRSWDFCLPFLLSCANVSPSQPLAHTRLSWKERRRWHVALTAWRQRIKDRSRHRLESITSTCFLGLCAPGQMHGSIPIVKQAKLACGCPLSLFLGGQHSQGRSGGPGVNRDQPRASGSQLTVWWRTHASHGMASAQRRRNHHRVKEEVQGAMLDTRGP